MNRLLAAIAAGLVIMTLAATPAVANPQHGQLSRDLSRLWTAVLQTPTAQNPYVGDGCFFLGRTLAPFAAAGVKACTVTRGTTLFEVGSSFECSSFDGDHPNFGTSNAELRRCAEANDASSAPGVTLDGVPVKLKSVETPVLRIVLPADNLFALPAGSTGRSVAHGWVARTHALSVGTHVIHISNADGSVIDTNITVQAHHCGHGE